MFKYTIYQSGYVGMVRWEVAVYFGFKGAVVHMRPTGR